MKHLTTVEGKRKIGSKKAFTIEGKKVELTCYSWYSNFGKEYVSCYALFK